jgi:hypothetical protein
MIGDLPHHVAGCIFVAQPDTTILPDAVITVAERFSKRAATDSGGPLPLACSASAAGAARLLWGCGRPGAC